MKRALAVILSYLLVIAPAFADRTVYAPVRLAPTATAGTVLFADGTAAAPSMSFSADTDTGIYRRQTNQIAITTNATARLTVDDVGYIFLGNGVSSASPAAANVTATWGTGTNISGGALNLRGGLSTGSAAGGAITFLTTAAGSSGSSQNSYTERMRITSAGDVGIGTNSVTSGYRLEVNGETGIIVNGGTDATLRLRGNTGSASYISIAEAGVNNKWAFGTSAGGSELQFRSVATDLSTGTERLRIVGSNGQIQVGDGTAAAPVLSFSGDTDTGVYRVGNDTLGVALGGAVKAVFSGASLYLGNGASSATPGSGSIYSTAASGTNTAGNGLSISGGESTGSANGGSIYLKTSSASTSGSSPNYSTDRLVVKPTGAVRFVPLAADPASASTGDVYYNSTSNKLKVYDGTSWVDLH